MLQSEYWVIRDEYTWMIFTNEYQFCTNLHMQEQMTKMMSQCQWLTFVWRHNELEYAILGDNGEMNKTCLFPSGLCQFEA